MVREVVDSDRPARSESAHQEDLELIRAALAGDQDAISRLRRQLHPVIVRYVRCVDPSPDFVDEIEQRFWCAALLPATGGPAKLESYSGAGPLALWAGVSAQRIAFNIRRHASTEQRAADRQRLEMDQATVDPELKLIKAHLRGRYREAVARALQVLTQHERLIYRMHLVDGVSLERIGHIYGVSHSTISRWLAAARGRVWNEVRRQLGEPPRQGEGAWEDSVGRFLDSDLELSLSRLLSASAT